MIEGGRIPVEDMARGDRVRVEDNVIYGHFSGKIGTVIMIGRDEVLVEFDLPPILAYAGERQVIFPFEALTVL